jgi:hypothetical protein
MRPYNNIRLNEFPDISDIQAEGRQSNVGRVYTPEGEYKSYTRNPDSRRAVRRALKRRDKQREFNDDE